MNAKEADATAGRQPRILLAEDDEVSREFLLDALSRLPAKIMAVADGATARDELQRQCFDLALLDRGLPSMDAMTIRQSVMSSAGANVKTPMLALSADVDAELRERFIDSGFVDLLAKPITASALRKAVRSILPASNQDWDEEQALAAANGNRDIAARLRQLMLQDLPGQREQLLQSVASAEFSAAHDLLHRMKAACAFCGAVRLAAACSELDDLLRDGTPAIDIGAACAEFEQACHAALGDPPQA